MGRGFKHRRRGGRGREGKEKRTGSGGKGSEGKGAAACLGSQFFVVPPLFMPTGFVLVGLK